MYRLQRLTAYHSEPPPHTLNMVWNTHTALFNCRNSPRHQYRIGPTYLKRKLHFGDVVKVVSKFGTSRGESLGMVVDLISSSTSTNSTKRKFLTMNRMKIREQSLMYKVLVDKDLQTLSANQLCWQYKLPYKIAKLRFLFWGGILNIE